MATQERPCSFSFSEGEGRSYIYIDLDEPFSQADFIEAITKFPGVEVTDIQELFRSFGPVEASDKVCTSQGEMVVSSAWEGMMEGHTISGETMFMRDIVDRMVNSKLFLRTS